jgi:hypothetical protein
MYIHYLINFSKDRYRQQMTLVTFEVVWVVTLCNSEKVYRCGRMYHPHLQSLRVNQAGNSSNWWQVSHTTSIFAVEK